MIEKLDNIDTYIDVPDCVLNKLNEVVDAVNIIQKEREAERFEIQEWIGILEAVRKSVNIHEKQIDELQMKLEPEKCEPDDPYTEQRNWIGKVCKFWDNLDVNYSLALLAKIREKDPMPFEDYRGNQWYHCEPVSLDDDIIYKKEEK